MGQFIGGVISGAIGILILLIFLTVLFGDKFNE